MVKMTDYAGSQPGLVPGLRELRNSERGQECPRGIGP